MQFAVVFVEYLVTGSGAVIWMGIVLGVTLTSVVNLQPAQVALLVPVIYLAGMLADAVASLLLHYPGRRAKRHPLPWQNRAVLVPDLQPRTAWVPFVVLHSPQLGQELLFRASRDRIARGALLNALLILVAMIVFPANRQDLLPFLPPPSVTTATGAGLVVLAAVLWWAAESSTTQFLQTSVTLIEHKLARERRPEKPGRAGITVPYTPRRRDL
ncbi:hypothetical protein [Longimicrobium sp.]|uniref:hypothetical protein n=1 Tax=Longimicrobium sp. TaxID=2029185 RepID=UPI002E30E128|nr:hypothetical protein [Longimicrobium sp.]HEX6042021.1 hypothetical protein [Longimicrobium sp.]